jgi:hypothetical protein
MVWLKKPKDIDSDIDESDHYESPQEIDFNEPSLDDLASVASDLNSSECEEQSEEKNRALYQKKLDEILVLSDDKLKEVIDYVINYVFKGAKTVVSNQVISLREKVSASLRLTQNANLRHQDVKDMISKFIKWYNERRGPVSGTFLHLATMPDNLRDVFYAGTKPMYTGNQVNRKVVEDINLSGKRRKTELRRLANHLTPSESVLKTVARKNILIESSENSDSEAEASANSNSSSRSNSVSEKEKPVESEFDRLFKKYGDEAGVSIVSRTPRKRTPKKSIELTDTQISCESVLTPSTQPRSATGQFVKVVKNPVEVTPKMPVSIDAPVKTAPTKTKKQNNSKPSTEPALLGSTEVPKSKRKARSVPDSSEPSEVETPKMKKERQPNHEDPRSHALPQKPWEDQTFLNQIPTPGIAPTPGFAAAGFANPMYQHPMYQHPMFRMPVQHDPYMQMLLTQNQMLLTVLTKLGQNSQQ